MEIKFITKTCENCYHYICLPNNQCARINSKNFTMAPGDYCSKWINRAKKKEPTEYNSPAKQIEKLEHRLLLIDHKINELDDRLTEMECADD